MGVAVGTSAEGKGEPQKDLRKEVPYYSSGPRRKAHLE